MLFSSSLFSDYSFPISPYLFAFISIVGIAAWSLLSRKILRGEKDFIAVGASTETLSLVLLAAMIILMGPTFGTTAQAAAFDFSTVPLVGWIALIISFLSYASAVMLSYKAYQTGEASERAVVTQVQNIWIVLIAAAFLSEPLLPGKILGVVLISVAAVLCTYRPGKSRWHIEGVKLFVLCAILFGTGSLADKVAVQYFPLMLYAPVSFIGSALVALALLGKHAWPRMKAVWKRHHAWMILFPIFSVVPYVAFLLAVRELPVSVVGPLLNTNVVLTALGGMILLGEHEGWPQKLAGALLAFIGAMMMGA